MEEVEKSSKKKIFRSAAYPAIDLKEAEGLAQQIAEHFNGKQSVSRSDIAAVLDKSEGFVARPIAALVHYSLLDKTLEGYKLSDLFKDIKNPIDTNELVESRIKAFKSPKLFEELIDKFNGRVVPTELKTHLVRFHSIAEKVADNAAEIFFNSARHAGVLNDKNILKIDIKGNTGNTDYLGEDYIKDDNEKKPPIKTPLELPEHNAGKEIPMHEMEEVPIRLKNGKHAKLIYPADITKKDLIIIRKQIDVLEAYVDDEDE